MTDLKRHDVPEEVETTGWTLGVAGAVDRPLELTHEELGSFPLETFSDDFVCEEGWMAEDLTWRGVHVGAVVDRAEPTETSEYGLVRAMDGDYACAFPLNRLGESILAIELDGEPLGPEHGGPARLVPTDSTRDCWESVKWVSHVEVLERAPTETDTARELALSRIE